MACDAAGAALKAAKNAAAWKAAGLSKMLGKRKRRESNSTHINSDHHTENVTDRADSVKSDKADSVKSEVPESDQFKHAWCSDQRFADWVIVRNGKVYCKYCMFHKEQNDFVRGKPTNAKWKKCRLSEHCEGKGSAGHKRAAQVYTDIGSRIAQTKAAREQFLEDKSSFLRSVIRCVHWLCMENVAMLKLRTLVQLVQAQAGCSTRDLPYANASRCREFVMSLSAVIKSRVWKDILASPAVSVLIDESTDVSQSENMIVYIIYMEDGTPIAKYVGLVHVSEVDADSITDTVLSFLAEN
jgi:hypothetical protein